MNDVVVYKLINRARLGNKESLDILAQRVEGRVFAYIYRVTLDYDLAQDLLQETLLEMVKSLRDLKETERFWYWLYRTAMGKIQHYYRAQKRKKRVYMSAFEKERLASRTSGDYDDGLDKILREELSEAMFGAMRKLKIAHRNVLVLRCLEQMPYSEIAVLMDCSELRARVLFFRAKNALKQRLRRSGFGRPFLLVALGLFGLVTAPAKAASSTGAVAAASVEVGFSAALIGTLTTKLGIVLSTFFAAATVALTGKTFLYGAGVVCLVLLGVFLFFVVGALVNQFL